MGPDMGRHVYRLVAAQLQDDGFSAAAQAVARGTMTPLPPSGALPSHALQQQLLGEMDPIEAIDYTFGNMQNHEYTAYLPRCKGHRACRCILWS